MTGVDWIIVGLLLLLALFGWAQGFVTGALALIGFALGAYLGTRLAGLVLPDGSRSPWAPAIGLVGALVLGAALRGGLRGARLPPALEAHAAGRRLRRRRARRAADRLHRARRGVDARRPWRSTRAARSRYEVQRSEILTRLNEALPPSGPLLNALARFDPFPRIDGPEANVAPPRAGIARDPQVRAAADSVVKILGTACGLGVEGSGWVAGDGIVVTNAHVVAGQEDTRVLVRGKEPRLDAETIAFNPRNDLAVLRVDGARRARAPARRSPRPGTSAAILGFPQNGPYDCARGGSGRRARA